MRARRKIQLTSDDITYFWEYVDKHSSHDFGDYDTSDASIEPDSLDQFDLTLPYPTEASHRYSFGTEHWKVLETDATVTTPAGEFTEVVVYQCTDKNEDYSSQPLFYLQTGMK